MLGEKICVRSNDTKQIVERVRDRLSARRGKVRRYGKRERVVSKVRMRMKVGKRGENRLNEAVAIEGFESESMGGTDVSGFVVQVVHGRGMERQDRKRRIFRAKLVNIMKPLKIPGVNIECNGVPAATCKDDEQLIERLSPVDLDAGTRRGG